MTRPAPILHRDDDGVTIWHGHCLDVLRTLPDESVHAIICDPPYGLSNTDTRHVLEALTAWLGGDREFVPNTGGGFMGNRWDDFVPPPAIWDECLRVLKPGGHLVAFAGSRTYDLMGLSIRLAGFDIRDGLAWLYGQGFPKSLDVAKAIDKRGGAIADFAEFRDAVIAALESRGLTRKGLREALGNDMISHYLTRGSQPAVPPMRDFRIIREFVGLDDRFDHLFMDEAEREVTGIHTSANWRAAGSFSEASRAADRRDAPATPQAAAWQGWGTALKPAFEPMVLARKPLTGTVAASVLEHGTGALNLDATRVASSETITTHSRGKSTAFPKRPGETTVEESGRSQPQDEFERAEREGRHPANVLLDPTAAAALDEQSGVLQSGVLQSGHAREPKAAGILGAMGAVDGERGYGDSGGASRFFAQFRYEPKAPKHERPTYTDEDGKRHAHATVKPLDLMRWLVRLLTPPRGIVLDPFLGSGTTAEAAVVEGFGFIGVESEGKYLPLIDDRLSKDIQQTLFGDLA